MPSRDEDAIDTRQSVSEYFFEKTQSFTCFQQRAVKLINALLKDFTSIDCWRYLSALSSRFRTQQELLQL